MAAAQREFRAALVRIGFSDPVALAVIQASGCNSIDMLGLLPNTQISKLCKTLRQRPNNPVEITALQEHLLLAMRYWVANLLRLGQPINAAVFTMQVAMAQAQIMNYEIELAAEKEMIAKAPDKFKIPTSWKVFAEALETYLGQLLGFGATPLKYVIRKQAVPIPNAVYMTEQEQKVATLPLIGPTFDRDNAKVYGIIKQLVLEGPGRSYVIPFDKEANGRAAWLALSNHFEGDAFRNRSKEEAYALLDNIHYEGERRGFTFEKYVEKHYQAFLELERYGEPVLEAKKVRDFLTRIHAPELQAAVQAVRASDALLGDFTATANFISLSIQPVKITTRALIGSTNTGNIPPDAHALGAGRGRSRGRFGQRSMQGRNPQVYARGRGRGRGRGHNVNQSNVNTGYYPPDQWQALPYEQRKKILEIRGTKRNISQVHSEQEDIPHDDYAEYANYSMAEQEQEEFIDAEALQLEQQQLITKKLMNHNAGEQFSQKGAQNRNIGMFTTSPRMKYQGNNVNDLIARTIARVSVSSLSELSYIELDTHADTSLAGANCKVIAYTEQMVEVSPYHPKYEGIKNVPIVQAGTAYDHPESGETYILILNQALYLGDQFPITLLNPNQARANQIIVDDIPRCLAPDPKTATHSIYFPDDNIRIPLELNGIISRLTTRLPTQKELETCKWLVLTADSEWNPHSNHYAEQEKLLDEQQPPLPLQREICSYHSCREYDTAPNEFYIALTQSLQIAATNTSTRYFRTKKEELATIWNVGLKTAEKTLAATTQLAIRNAVKPLHRRFRTDVAQLRYPRLGGRHGIFHTDTFFAPCNSLHGHIMGQLYVNDIDFVKFIPMKKKSDAPDTLVEFCQDIGIPSELHSDNANELTKGRWGELTK